MEKKLFPVTGKTTVPNPALQEVYNFFPFN